MRAADTSVIVRLLMRDDPDQYSCVTEMLQNEMVCVTPAVLRETEWVLRGVYRLPLKQIQRALRNLLGLAELRFEAAEAIAFAVDWCERGMDFADALHFVTARECDGIATLDRDFIKTATRTGAGRVAAP